MTTQYRICVGIFLFFGGTAWAIANDQPVEERPLHRPLGMSTNEVDAYYHDSEMSTKELVQMLGILECNFHVQVPDKTAELVVKLSYVEEGKNEVELATLGLMVYRRDGQTDQKTYPQGPIRVLVAIRPADSLDMGRPWSNSAKLQFFAKEFFAERGCSQQYVRNPFYRSKDELMWGPPGMPVRDRPADPKLVRWDGLGTRFDLVQSQDDKGKPRGRLRVSFERGLYYLN